VKVALSFEPYRLSFSNAGAPTMGPESAPVTLVEFSDFQCPYCRAAAPTLKQVANKYGDKVHIVYRQYPIASLHPFALKAAEASLCANEQGKFWPLHDRMFDDQTKLGVSDLKQQARELGMDGKKFDACLDAGKYVEQVQNDMKEGQRSRVAGLRQYSSTAVWWRRFSAVPRTRGADRQGVGARKADVLTRCTNGAG